MSFQALNEPTFIFNNENIQAYQAWAADKHIGKTFGTIKKIVLKKFTTSSFADLADSLDLKQHAYAFFYNPARLKGQKVTWSNDIDRIADYPKALREQLVTSDVNFRDFNIFCALDENHSEDITAYLKKVIIKPSFIQACELPATKVAGFWEYRMLANDISATDRGYDFLPKHVPC